jgi:ABC-type transport system involved in cytochrome c biogenesis permease component
MRLVTSACLSSDTRFVWRAQHDAGKFFIFVCFMELCSLTATSLALMISTFCRTVTLSITILPLILEVCSFHTHTHTHNTAGSHKCLP